jgi:flagellar biogenesis protein FliO
MLILEFGRMVLALGLVLGLLWLFSKFGRSRQVKSRGRWMQGGADAGRIEVMDRRSLGRHSSIAVVRAAGRIVVVGQTPQQISVLLDADRDPVGAGAEIASGATSSTDGLPRPDEEMLLPGLASTTGVDAPKAWDAFLERLREMTVRH